MTIDRGIDISTARLFSLPRPPLKLETKTELPTSPIQHLSLDNFSNLQMIKGELFGALPSASIVYKAQSNEHPTIAAAIKPADKQGNLEHQWGPEIWIHGETVPHREVAAYLVAHELDFDFVPPTTFRKDIKGGSSLQLWREGKVINQADLEKYDKNALVQIAVLNHIIGSIDCHRDNLIVSTDGSLSLIDNGLSFPAQIDGFYNNFDLTIAVTGEKIPEELLTKLEKYVTRTGELTEKATQLTSSLQDHLSTEEISYIFLRLKDLLDKKRVPNPLQSTAEIPPITR